MPDDSFSIKTDFDSFSNSLIIDERGELSTLLVDGLLSQGCLVNYYGKENNDTFYYLQEKNSFSYLNSIEELVSPKNINYIFYFPEETENSESQDKYLETLGWFCGKHNSKLLISCSYLNPNKEKILNYFKSTNINFRLVIYGDIFGPRVKSGFLGNLFLLGLKEKSIHIPENPLTKFFPISSDILTAWLIRLVFSTDTKGKTFFLETEAINFFEFNEIIKKLSFKSKLTFDENKDIFQMDLGKNEILKIEQNLEEKMFETVEWFGRNQKIDKVVDADKEEKEPETKKEENEVSRQEQKLDFLYESDTDVDSREKQQRPIEKEEVKRKPLFKKILVGGIFYLLLFIFFFCGPVLFSGITGFVGIKHILKAKEGIIIGDLAFSYLSNKSAEKFLRVSSKTISIAGPFYSLIGFGEQIQLLSDLIEFSGNLNDSIGNLLQACRKTTLLANNFVNGESSRWDEDLSEIKRTLNYAYEKASLSQTSLERLEKIFQIAKKEDLFKELKSVIPQYREILLKGQGIVSVVPDILSISGRKKYLVLLQNNMEIRPTGGFIGSYAIVGVENGKLVNFEVFDVYQADGQLKGHVEPPEKLKKYLGEATWYLRDSNWDPDYPVSARRAQWFLDKEMQVTVDGTIAITLETAKNLLQVFGEVEIPQYDEKVSSENIFEKAEYYSELGTFPGSTQKKDFLGSLSGVLLEKIKNSSQKDFINVAAAILKSVEEKEILFYFNDAKVQQTVLNLDWGGEIKHFTPKSSTGTVFSDYLFLNETNVGINKANYFVTREIDHNINIKQSGKIEEKIVLTYENNSPSDNWPGGRYKTYLRVFLPQGAKINSVLATDPLNPSLWLPFDNSLIDESMASGKSVLGILVEVPIKTKRKIEIKYELPEQIDFSNKLISYLVLSQKQSGAYPSVYNLEVTYPGDFVPVRVIPSAVVKEERLLITSKLTKDLIFQIDLVH